MKIDIKKIWMIAAVSSLILLGFHWFGFDSKLLENSILILNVLAFATALPCSLFVVPVLFASNYYLEINPVSSEGVYLNTIFLSAIGAMQWFWVARFWSPKEPQVQMLGMSGNHIS